MSASDIPPPSSNQPSQTYAPDAETQARTAPIKPRKKRRFLKFMLVCFVLLVGIIAAAPYIASTKSGANALLGMLNRQIQGHVDVKDVSLSWTGPIELRGVEVTDPEDRVVLASQTISMQKGLAGLITAPLHLGRITADNPDALLFLDRNNDLSIARAFSPRTKSTEPPGPLPDLHGTLVLKDGDVRTQREGGESYDVSGLTGEVELASLSNWKCKLDLTTADGTTITSDVDVRDLVRDNAFAIAGGSGTLNVKTSGPVALGPLLKVLAPGLGMDGALAIDIKTLTEGGKTTTDFNLAASQMRALGDTTLAAAPIDFTLIGKGSRNGDILTADFELSGDPGTIKSDIVYNNAGKPIHMTPDELLAAVVSGKAINLPDLVVNSTGSIDLAKLQKAIPGLLKTNEGQQITGGRLEIASLTARGGDAPSAKGTITVKDLSATSGGKVVRVEPITLNINSELTPGKGLFINALTLDSSFAKIGAKGSSADLTANFQGSLARMQQDLGQIFDLSSFTLAGEFKGDVRMQRVSDDRIDMTLAANTQGLKYGAGQRVVDLGNVTVKNKSALMMVNNAVRRIDISDTQADLGGQVIVAADGFYEVDKKAYSANLDVSKADLAYLAPRATALGMPELARFSGNLTAKATAKCDGANQPMITSGSATAMNVAVDKKPALEGTTNVQWTQLKVGATGDRIDLESAKIDGPSARIDARQLVWQSGAAGDLRADISGNAELASLLRTAAAFSGDPNTPAISGRWSIEGKIASAGGDLSINGRGGVDNLVVGEGKDAIREKRLEYEIDGKLDSKSRLTLSKGRIVSTPLTADITGSIDQLNTTRVLALRGSYDASWEQLTAILHELSPATAKTVLVRGKSAGELEINGPLSQPNARPAFRGLTGGTTIGWDGAALYGIALGQARIQPALKDGRISIPQTAIAVSEGRVNLRGDIDFTGADPVLRVPGQWNALENVAVTREMGAELLSHINPIFMFMSRLEGKINLNSTDLVLPFGSTDKSVGAGKGMLDLRQMQMQPGGFLGELLELGGLPIRELYPVEVGKVDFVVRDGRIFYDNFTLSFPDKFDVKFYGSVGLDDSIDLIVSLPVSPKMLAKLGVSALPVDLTGLRIDVPMVGTRENPRLDFSKVDTKKLLQAVIKPNDPGKILGGILGGDPLGTKPPGEPGTKPEVADGNPPKGEAGPKFPGLKPRPGSPKLTGGKPKAEPKAEPGAPKEPAPQQPPPKEESGGKPKVKLKPRPRPQPGG